MCQPIGPSRPHWATLARLCVAQRRHGERDGGGARAAGAARVARRRGHGEWVGEDRTLCFRERTKPVPLDDDYSRPGHDDRCDLINDVM